MLEGQHGLNDDKFRGRIFGVGEFTLHDWFVPVLFQEKEDPQLFRNTPAPQTQEDLKTILGSRLGELPPVPETGFIGRSRELLALQRLLRRDRYAVVRGQGGEGKTALASEFARWMVRSQQLRRAAFVSVETHSHVAAVLDALGHQLVGPEYSVATFDNLEQAILPVERALVEQATLLVVDNMESLLLPPFLADETPEALSEDAHHELDDILQLCVRLNAKGNTQLVFTSRETLPAPFDAERNRRELYQLDREDAVKLVERVLNAAGGDAGAPSDAAREQIEQLVDAVHCHARTLALLAPALRERGVEATRASLVKLMEEMDKWYPVGHREAREKSVYASVELSLQRLSAANQERAHVLGVFHGGVYPNILEVMMQWERVDVISLMHELIATGLATQNRYHYLTLNPALCPYLRGRLDAAEREALMARWVEATREYVEFLYQQSIQNAEVATTLTGLELPNLLALFDLVQRAGEAEATIDLATSLYRLLQNAGKPRLLARVGQVRDAAEATLRNAWTHARFQAAQTHLEQQLDGGQWREALDGAQALLQRARAVGEQAYPGANYDLVVACFLLARVLQMAGGSEQALPLLIDARQRFEAIAKAQPGGRGAERMVSACLTDQGDCLCDLGRLDDAAVAYEEAIRRAEQCDNDRQIAVGKLNLRTVRLQQRRYPEALAAYTQARERFIQLDEPGTVAGSWHQTGIVYQDAGLPDAAEDAYRQALVIWVRLGNVAGQARTLLQLGNLYSGDLDRPEDAAAFYRQAVDKYVEIGDAANEGRARANLGDTLRKLRRLIEARQEVLRAVECKAPFGYTAEPWKSWAILANIETDASNPAAAAEARAKAIASYLAYRRDGGENHSGPGRLAFDMTEKLRVGGPGAAAAFLKQLATDPDLTELRPFTHALQAIVVGSRDRALADVPGLSYGMAAEILFLIETLEKHDAPHPAQAS